MSDRCYYCETEQVDHKHGGGHSCGDCCGMHGEIAHENPEAYKWVDTCIKAKNERIARLEAQHTADAETIAIAVSLNRDLGKMGDELAHSQTTIARRWRR